MKKIIILFTYICLTLLFVYYVFSLFSLIFSNNEYFSLLHPQKAPINKISKLIHAHDPEFLTRYIKENKTLSIQEQYDEYTNLFLYDPYNKDVISSYLTFLYKFDNENFFTSISPILLQFFPQILHTEIENSINIFTNKQMEENFQKYASNISISTRSIQEDFARIFYLIGHDLLDNDPLSTLHVWNLSTLMDPSLSYYAIETASVAYNMFGNQEKAVDILQRCMNNKSAKNHCEELIQKFLRTKELLPAGFFYEDILKR